MEISFEAADHIVDAAVTAVKEHPASFERILDRMNAAIYVTDNEGTITYYNDGCIELAGRTPAVGQDKWCVTWKLFTEDGEPLPHDRCPMAVAVEEGRPVRNVGAIAERPDGSRIAFMPYPTPIFDREGRRTGAVNLLVPVSARDKPAYFHDQAARCRRLAAETGDPGTVETLSLMAAKYDEQSLRKGRSHSR